MQHKHDLMNELYSRSLESQQMVSIFWNKFRTFRVAFMQPLNDGCSSYKKQLHGNVPMKVALESTEHLNLTQKEPTTGVTFEQPLSDGCLRCIKAILWRI